MDEALQNRCVKCPTCGDVFTVGRGLALAEGAEAPCPVPAAVSPGEDRGWAERRIAERANTVSIRILYEATLREFPVKDITPNSIGVYHLGWRFELGRSIHFDLIEGYKFLLKGLTAKVVRIDDEAIGALFENVPEGDLLPIYQAALTRDAAAGTVLDAPDDDFGE
ncbi:PilZ domain-containing protein [Megalodesulfovibrio paquesii]